ncbi:MAG: SUMF1/EgtB/PvdO family nonheme iron enzyme, partial [Candidatus Eisenbacteria bacterium]|nr:SUMF1/EgtB/PvdO family nonheme iron enzyme [Candidatus Eisenbacteria bacterium]
VEIWSTSENDGESEMIGSFDQPNGDEALPDTLHATEGASVYFARWYTRLLTNGTKVRLFSKAFDVAGNTTRSDLVTVRILNMGGDLRPPRPQIVITPASGTTQTFFTFDASTTEDDIDPPEEIIVRWDFDSDGVWDHDFAENLPATSQVSFKYSRPGIYTVKIEAKNTYLPNRVGANQRQVSVSNVGGDPNPPDPANMAYVPAGLYQVGSADPTEAEGDELPAHDVRFTSGFYIEKTEVTNTLYLQYLESAMAGDSPLVRRDTIANDLIFYPNLTEPVEEDSLPVRIVDLDKSALFYDPEGDRMAVLPDAGQFPVVGVTWYGAKAYAEHFGLRLPTEHEWEVAAKGTHTEYIYAWGTTIAPEQANYLDSGYGALRPVGSYPGDTSPFGLLDVSGNAAEWTKDWYGPYPSAPQTNPEGPIEGVLRVIRGGSYAKSAYGVRVTGREATAPDVASDQVGFRTAYSE